MMLRASYWLGDHEASIVVPYVKQGPVVNINVVSLRGDYAFILATPED